MTQPMASDPNITARPMHSTATRLISSIGRLGNKLADNVRALRPDQITLRRMCRLDGCTFGIQYRRAGAQLPGANAIACNSAIDAARRRALCCRASRIDLSSIDRVLSRQAGTSGRGRLSAMPKGTKLKPATGATPLIAIAAAAVDTETTGPDATKARVVQIGAIGIAHGKVVRESQLALLIDPGEAIPPEASLVHGITDADVDGAGSFPDAWAQFQEFVGDRILVGHSIGFDLAVLERECRRASLPWAKPRALCVRLLATIANPNLADHSLETIAAWLRLEIAGRHSALGDAIAAGDIFAGLIPELRKRNIRTRSRPSRRLGRAGVATPGSRVSAG
ncbi:MAG: 3'-5' exonuclease [Mesorhizobium sp.]|nr:MAG: 3'-5' exonuclease [Mesorhizobium sp.]